MPEKKFDVIGLGQPIQDLLVELEQLPETNHNLAMNDYIFQGGGNVATAMVASGMMGLKAAMIGSVGDDLFGNALLADFEFNGVDTSHIIVESGTRTDFCICVTERAVEGKEFISKQGTCHIIQPEQLDEAFIQSGKVLHVGILTPAAIRACEMMHAGGGKVSIDAAYYRPDIYGNYCHLDIFIASENYYNKMHEEMKTDMTREETCRFIQKQGPEIVIFTFGTEGCFGVDKHKYFEMPCFKVETVDSTGAGDVFHGAFIYAWLQGWDIERAARFCSGVSAIKCTQRGGRAGIPTPKNVLHFIETGKIDTDEINRRVDRYRLGFIRRNT